MRYVYGVLVGYNYEGEDVVGMYSSLREARANRPKKGSYQLLHRYELGTGVVDGMEWEPKSSPCRRSCCHKAKD